MHWPQVACLLVLVAAHGALAGLVISSDNSDLCNSNMKECSQRCPPPQNFLFMCSSGGTFSKPQSDCKCITPPPAGVITDGSSTWQMVQWPGAEPCQGNSWLYDCAQYLNLNAMANNLNGQATDQASAMAAVAAAKAAAEAQAAQEAQMAAMAAQQQQQQQQAGQAGSPSAAMGPAPAAVPGMDPGAGGVPGMGAGGAGSTADGGAMGGGQGMQGGGMGMGMGGGQGMQGGGMGMGQGMGAQNPGMMGGGAGMMGSPGATPGASLMGAGSMGHRHLLQFGAGAGAGAPLGAGGAGPAGGLGGSGSGALPSTQLGAACQKPIQGVVTGANSGVLVIPNFKGVGSMMTKGNDTMFIQLGGQGSQCVAGYKLMGGKIMDVGRTKEEVQKQQDAAKKSSAGVAAPGLALALLVGLLVVL